MKQLKVLHVGLALQPSIVLLAQRSLSYVHQDIIVQNQQEQEISLRVMPECTMMKPAK
jgi:hypothetical protein